MSTAKQVGHEAEDSPLLDAAVRIGLVAYGVVHLLIAWLAIQLAFGQRSQSASTKGAMHELAQQPFGKVLVWAIALGMFLLVIWRVIEAAFGHREEDGSDRLRKRVVSGAKAVIYAAVGVSALKVAIGSGGSGNSSDSYTAKVLDLPAGPWLVGLVGLAIIGYGGNLAWRGWSDKHAEHLDAEGKSGDTGTAYLFFGKVGYIAKGISMALVGGLFVYAGVTHDPKKSGGLDQALHKLLQQPFGMVMLIAIGVGLGCYGLFCFARARHLSR
jgi:hypothetical protein